MTVARPPVRLIFAPAVLLLLAGCGGGGSPTAAAPEPAPAPRPVPPPPPAPPVVPPPKEKAPAEQLDPVTPVPRKYDPAGGRPVVHFGEKRIRMLVVQNIGRGRPIEASVSRVYDAAGAGELKQVGRDLDSTVGQFLSPDGKLVFGHNWAEAGVWDADTGERVAGPFVRKGGVKSLALSPDGKRLAVGGEGAVVNVWRLDTGKEGTPIKTGNGWGGNVLRFSHDGTRLATEESNGFRVWDVATAAPLTPVMRHEGMLTALHFSPDDTRLVSGVLDGSAQVWDAATGKAVGPRMTHPGHVWDAVFSPDGKWVATAAVGKTTPGGSARVWDAATGEPVTPPLGTKGFVGVAFDPTGKRLAAVPNYGDGAVWEVGSATQVVTLKAEFQEHWKLNYSPDGRFIALHGRGPVTVVDAATGRLLHQGSR